MPGASQSSRLSELTAGLDIGTTTVKAVVADEDGNIVQSCRFASELLVEPAGRFEHNATTTWWQGPRDALLQVLSSSSPQAVAVSAMMPSVAAVDGAGTPIGPGLLYGDSRGGRRQVADPTTSDEMASLCRWAAQDTPGAAGYWPAQAVANASLSGEGVTDLASAFAAGPLFNGSGWDAPACAEAGLSPEQLPRVAVFGEPVGKIDVANLGPTALRSEIVLGAGSVDGFCEQLVAGVLDDGDVLIGLGSTLVVWLTVPGWPEPVPDLWRVPHFVPGKAIVGGASNAGGMWADWVNRVIRPVPEIQSAPEIQSVRELQGSPGATQGLRPGSVPIWWPWANGERVPWHDRSLRIGLAAGDISQGPGALRRAAYEATGFVARYIVELASLSGTQAKRFFVSGGGAAHPAWLKAVADVLGKPVLPMAVPQGAALGAAFMARMALGLETSVNDASRWARWSAPVEPATDWVEATNERYQRWCAGLPDRP